jgi:tetratricopeptide (TPR) repeat protein
VIFSVGKRFDLALLDYTRAIQFNPDYGSAYLNRAKTHMEMGRHQQALADAVKARSLGVPEADPLVRQLQERILNTGTQRPRK